MIDPRSKIDRPSIRGFTLIELIASLLLVSILAVLLFPLWNKTVTSSAETGTHLTAAHEIRNEMEKWHQSVRTSAAGDFNQLPTLIETHFQTIPEISIIENFWVDFDQLPDGSIQETVAREPTDCLRITIRHSTGPELTSLFTRPLE